MGHQPSDALAASLVEHVRRELGPIATPAALEFVAGLPKTRSGKILGVISRPRKRALRSATSRRSKNRFSV